MTPHRSRLSRQTLSLAALLVAWTAATPRAEAYWWMIRHGYTECGSCHVDPSGGGLLNAYGRAQGSLVMATRWGDTDDEAVSHRGQFLFGAVDLPEELQLGADFRPAALVTSVDGQTRGRGLLMQADLEVGVHASRFHAEGSLGFATDGAFAASVVGTDSARLISRSHWLGVDIGAHHEWLVRAGRFNLPFGVRMLEHTAWVRKETQVDINVAQQHGLAVSYTGHGVRAEVMGILGNFQISPDIYRERGYSLHIEVAPAPAVAIGVSSLVTHVDVDPTTQEPLIRHAHGLFLRAAATDWLALSAEGDFILYSQPTHNAYGAVGWLQADAEVTQGLHLILSLETDDHDVQALGVSIGGWASVAWFFYPHFDVRIDGVVQSVDVPGARVTAESLVGQLHFYL